MTESRKRPYSDDEDPISTTKKRATTASRNSSPQPNGSLDDEEAFARNVELFRKEAIFRKMRHYAREHQRSQSLIAELEQRKRTCEMGLAAIMACWTQLIEFIKPLVRTEHSAQLVSGLLDFQLHVDDDWEDTFPQALEDKLGATRRLVQTLVKPDGSQIATNNMEAHNKLVAECLALRSQLGLMRANVKNMEEERENYHNALVLAESRLDRQKSSTIIALEAQAAKQQKSLVAPETEQQGKPSSPRDLPHHAHINGSADLTELDALREALQSRESKLRKAESHIFSLEEQLVISKAQSHTITDGAVMSHPVYKALDDYAFSLNRTLEETRLQLSSTTNELAQLQTSRQEWEDNVMANATQMTNELKSMLAKRDQENARLRDQREQQHAELLERRMDGSAHSKALLELKNLVQSQADRITTLESELTRHKARIAANAGKEDLMLFITNGKGDEAKYFESLEDRVKVAETRAAALQQAISGLDTSQPDIAHHISAATVAAEKLASVEAELNRYKAVFGSATDTTPDWAREIRSKEDEIRRLRNLEVQFTQAESSLYNEIERLSSAWESLDKQVRNKVFSLIDAEERLKKLGSEKAKLENKYYAVMREKGEADNERKNALRNVEKQSKVVEHLREAEKSLASQINTLHRELAKLNVLNLNHKNAAEILEAKLRDANAEKDRLQKWEHQLLPVLRQQEHLYLTRVQELRQMEDNLLRSKKEVEQRQKELESMRKDADDGDDENTEAYKMLQCVCRKKLRDTIITKCMHTFCKNCVEDRITTRQRRCPYCNASFAQSDVQPLWFQY